MNITHKSLSVAFDLTYLSLTLMRYALHHFGIYLNHVKVK